MFEQNKKYNASYILETVFETFSIYMTSNLKHM